MTPYYSDEQVTLHHGDCLDVLRELPDASVDAVVTDPPYGLANTTPEQVADTLVRWVNGDRDYLPTGHGFMGKSWDAFVPPVAVWDDCLRVLKPGGHALVFAGSRTHDLMTLGLRLAGFEVRDSIAWLYGSGFPKSLDVSKAIDKAAGATREVVGAGEFAARRPASRRVSDGGSPEGEPALHFGDGHTVTAPATDAARQWRGWGTALKPAFEPVVVARKPLSGTVAQTVLAHGTGALNVDGCRVAHQTVNGGNLADNPHLRATIKAGDYRAASSYEGPRGRTTSHTAGRWPTNVVLDGDAAHSVGEESRFFPVFANGRRCMLSGCSNASANTADDSSSPTPAPADGSAPAAATTSSAEPNDRAASSAETQCDSCATATAARSAATGAVHLVSPVPGQPSTDDSSALSPTPSPAPSVATPANSGTISTTTGSTTSLGCVGCATRTCTTQACPPSARRSAASSPESLPDPFAPPFAPWKYQAKAPTRERVSYEREGGGFGAQNYGGYKTKTCDECGTRFAATQDPTCGHGSWSWQEQLDRKPDRVSHPTVKPLALMRWLVRLVTPPGGVVLDPFAGSGTTIEAAMLEGFRCIGIEREADYLPLIEARIARNQTTETPAVDDGALFDKPQGRWPTNVVMDRATAAALDEQTGDLSVNAPATWRGGTTGTDGTQTYGAGVGTARPGEVRGGYGDKGGASRFFPVFDGDQPTLFDDDGDAA